MRRRLARIMAMLSLIAATLAVAAPAQADPYFTANPPEGCYLYTYTHQGFTYASQTYCTRMHGLHRAAARCADGRVMYGDTMEMDYNLMSLAECRWPAYYGKPIPAVEVWGEFWPDY